MATYPSFGQLVGSTADWVDGLQVDRAVNGSVKARSFFPAKKRRFVLRHVLNATDVGTLQTFYDTYRLTANTITWRGDSVAYTVLFEAPPSIKPLGAAYSEVEVRLVEQ